MKRKGITVWEEYLEYMVLGVAVLFLLGFGAFQFLSAPNQSNVPGAGEVPPGEIDGLLQERAERLADRLAGSANSPIEVPEPQPVLDSFLESIGESISPNPMVAAIHPGSQIIEGTAIQGQDVMYVVPDVPAPTQLVVDQHFDALGEGVVSDTPQLSERFTAPPYDITWTTPAALFDLASVRQSFSRTGPNGEFAIPSIWYKDQIDIIDIRVEREELVNGEWSERTLLDTIPGQFGFREKTYREEAEDDPDKNTRDQIQGELREGGMQRSVVQPAFYPLKNDSWVRPDPTAPVLEDLDEEATEEQREIARLRRQLSEAIRKRDSAAERLEELGASVDEDDPSNPPVGGGGSGGRGGAGGGAPPPPGGGGGFGAGSGGGNPGRRGPGQDRQENQIKRLREAYQRAVAEIERYQSRLESLTQQDVDVAESSNQNGSLMDRDELVVWAHDITVEHGKTYRYRITIDIANPFFARKLDLVEEQQDLADSLVMRSTTSEWSRPVRIIQPTRIFMTRADAPGSGSGNLGFGKATAEVFRFYDGRWWRETFSVEPGDHIGTLKEIRRGNQMVGEVDFSTDWFVLDVIANLEATEQQEDRGWGAKVIMRSLSDPAVTMELNPQRDYRSLERERLRGDVDTAELASFTPDEEEDASG